MSFPWRKKNLGLLICVVGLAYLLAACGNQTSEVTTADTSCPSGAAQINVTDGFLRIICGCAEAAGTIATPPTTLTCTVPAGTTVFFYYEATTLRHQIIPTGSPSFVPSPINDPKDIRSMRSHAVKLDASGTYPFADAMNTTINGQLIVP